MDYEFSDDPINSPNLGEDAIRMSLMDGPSDHDYGQRHFSRLVKSQDIKVGEDEVTINVEVTDNINGGFIGGFDITEDFPGGTKERYEATITMDRTDYDDRMEDHRILDSPHRIVLPTVKEWAQNATFQADIEPIPDELRHD